MQTNATKTSFDDIWVSLAWPRRAERVTWVRNTSLLLPLRANISNQLKSYVSSIVLQKAIDDFFFFFASENTAQVLRQRAAPLIKDGKIKSELKLLLFMSNELMPVSRKMDPDFTAAAAVAIGSQISPWNRISKARSFFLLSARFDLGSSFFFFFLHHNWTLHVLTHFNVHIFAKDTWEITADWVHSSIVSFLWHIFRTNHLTRTFYH